MVLSGIKKASAKRKIKAFLANREDIKAPEAIESIGVIVDVDQFPEIGTFLKLKTLLKAHEVEILSFSETKKTFKETEEGKLFYTPADIGVSGSLQKQEIKDFASRDLDLLICYTKRNNITFNLLTAASRAALKVGINIENEAFYDLIIRTEMEQTEAFFTELKKYLQILKLLKNE